LKQKTTTKNTKKKKRQKKLEKWKKTVIFDSKGYILLPVYGNIVYAMGDVRNSESYSDDESLYEVMCSNVIEKCVFIYLRGYVFKCLIGNVFKCYRKVCLLIYEVMCVKDKKNSSDFFSTGYL
jgi:hypothetical protein